VTRIFVCAFDCCVSVERSPDMHDHVSPNEHPPMHDSSSTHKSGKSGNDSIDVAVAAESPRLNVGSFWHLKRHFVAYLVLICCVRLTTREICSGWMASSRDTGARFSKNHKMIIKSSQEIVKL